MVTFICTISIENSSNVEEVYAHIDKQINGRTFYLGIDRKIHRRENENISYGEAIFIKFEKHSKPNEYIVRTLFADTYLKQMVAAVRDHIQESLPRDYDPANFRIFTMKVLSKETLGDLVDQ